MKGHHQVVDLRSKCPLSFGDASAQSAYQAERARARKVQAVRYAVAPRCSVKVDDGRVLGAGAEVRVEYFTSVPGRPAWRRLELLVHQGLVLEADIDPSAA